MEHRVTSSFKISKELLNAFFIENRARLLDLAAFLDRLDETGDPEIMKDFRVRAFREGLEVLVGRKFPRTVKIQMLLSDRTSDAKPKLDQKNAWGAYNPSGREE
jgi:hypothetical protein